MKNITLNDLTTAEKIIIKFDVIEGCEHMYGFVKNSVINVLSVSGKVIAISNTNSDTFKAWMTLTELLRWISIVSNVTSAYEKFIGIELQ